MLEAQRLAVSWDGVIDLLVALQVRWRDGEMAKYSGRQKIVALRDGEMARYTHMHMQHATGTHMHTRAPAGPRRGRRRYGTIYLTTRSLLSDHTYHLRDRGCATILLVNGR